MAVLHTQRQCLFSHLLVAALVQAEANWITPEQTKADMQPFFTCTHKDSVVKMLKSRALMRAAEQRESRKSDKGGLRRREVG